MAKRIKWLDIAKAIAIMLIVLYHVTSKYWLRYGGWAHAIPYIFAS